MESCFKRQQLRIFRWNATFNTAIALYRYEHVVLFISRTSSHVRSRKIPWPTYRAYCHCSLYHCIFLHHIQVGDVDHGLLSLFIESLYHCNSLHLVHWWTIKWSVKSIIDLAFIVVDWHSESVMVKWKHCVSTNIDNHSL